MTHGSYEALSHVGDFFKMSVENWYAWCSKSFLHVGNMMLARPLDVGDFSILAHFIPENAVECCPCLKEASVVICFADLRADRFGKFTKLGVVGSQSQSCFRRSVDWGDVSVSTGEHDCF